MSHISLSGSFNKQISENFFVVEVFEKHTMLGMEKLESLFFFIFDFCLK